MTDQARYPHVHVDVTADQLELTSLAFWESGALGVEERDDATFERGAAPGKTTLVASFDSEAAAQSAIDALRPELTARFHWLEGDSWRDGWRAYFKPLRVAEHLVVRPSWEAFEPLPQDVVITLDPGGAFGTGTHESTQLVLAALEQQRVEVAATRRVLDVGCGSGILSVAAVLLGADSVLAIDLDPAALDATRENAVLNDLGSEIETASTPLGEIDGVFGLVLANIEAHVLIPIAAELAARVRPGGLLILSGVLVSQTDDVLAAYPHMACLARPTRGEWTALLLRASGSAP